MSNVGYATLTVIPSMKGFATKLNSGLAAPMASSGRSAGLSFARGFAVVGGAVAVTGMIKSAVQLEAQFSKTMRQIAVATNAPKTEMADLDALATELGKNTIFSSSDAAEAMLELAKNGLSPAVIQAGALKEALTLAAAGGVDLTDAATTMGNALNTFGLRGSDAGSVAAAIAGAANASSASVESLSEGLQQVGAVADDTGLSIQETTAALAQFANAGISGSDAGTSLKTFLTRLIPSTKKAKEAMDDLGLSFTNSDGSFKDLNEIAEELTVGFADMSDAERAAAMNTIFGSDARRAATVLMNGGADAVDRYVKSTSDQTQADRLAKTAMEGTSGAIEKLSGSWDTAMLSVGKGLAPIVEGAANDLAGFLDGIDFEKVFADFIDGAKELGDNLRPLYDTAMPLLIDAFKSIGPFLKDVTGYVGDFAGLIGGLPKPVQEWGIKIAAAAFAFNKLSTAMAGSRMATAFSTFNAGMRDAATRTDALKSAGRTAVGAGGLGLVVDAMDETGTRAGALKTTLGAAAVGFGVAGPWGAAIGGAIGALKSFTDWSDNAEEAQKELETRMAGVAATFEAETGAIGLATRSKVLDQLEEAGVADDARTAGVDVKLLVDYAIDKPRSDAALDAAIEAVRPESVPVQTWADFEAQAASVNAMNGDLPDVDPQTYADSYNKRVAAYEAATAAIDELRQGVADERRVVEGGHEAWEERQQDLGLNIVDMKAYRTVLEGMPKDQRTAFVQEGLEISLGRAQALSEKYGDTPKEVETTLRALGYEDAANKANSYGDILRTLPPKVATAFAQEGMDLSINRAIELTQKYNLTPAQVKTIMIANGFTKAEQQVMDVSTALGGVDGKRAQVYIDVVTDVQQEYNNLINTFGDALGGIIPKKAGGGRIGGIGTGTSDSNLAWLSKGEWVTRQKAAAYYGDDFMRRLNNMQLPRFATGGLVGPAQPRASISGGVTINVGTVVAHDYNDFMQQMQRRSRAGAAAYA